MIEDREDFQIFFRSTILDLNVEDGEIAAVLVKFTFHSFRFRYDPSEFKNDKERNLHSTLLDSDSSLSL